MKQFFTTFTLLKLLRLLTVTLAFYSLSVIGLQAQVFQWVKGMTFSSDGMNPLAVDAAGNSFYAGNFNGQVTIQTITINAPGSNFFVCKFDPVGNVVWAKHFPFGSYAKGIDLAVDPSGDIYFTGYFQGPVSFGTTTLVPTPGPQNAYDFFLTKLNSSGDAVWAMQGVGTIQEYPTNLSLDGAGNLFLVGSTGSTSLNFNGQTISGTGSNFLMKVNSSGQMVWGKRLPVTQLRVSVSANGNGFITGNFTGPSLDLGNSVIIPNMPTNSNETTFVAAFNPGGLFLWGHGFGGTYVSPLMVKTGPAGDVYVLSEFSYTFSFAGTTLANPNWNFQTRDLSLIKLSSGGAMQWMKKIGLGSNTTFHLPGELPLLEVDNAGNCIVANHHVGTAQLADSVWRFPLYPAMHEVTIAKYDANGQFLWAQGIDGGGQEYISRIGIDGLGNVLVCGFTTPNFQQPTPTYFGNHLNFSHNSNWYNYVCKIMGNANRFSGKVFLDLNSTGTQENNETGLPFTGLAVQPSQLNVLTQGLGDFHAFTEAGNFQVTIPQVPAYYNASPNMHSAVFTGIGQVDSLNNFALQPISPVQDLQISLMELGAPRPGFQYRTRINYRNVGTVPVSGTIKFVSDTLLTFQGALPQVGSTTGDTLSWIFSTLQPYESRSITIDWLVPVSAALGTQLMSHAFVGPESSDQTPLDNRFSDSTIVVGSFDPNDKLVSHALLSPNQVISQESLTYTVRFQNTGTDTAFVVLVRDQFSSLLDMSTVEVISASHPFTAQFTISNTIDWKFNNILLPDSNTNELASHGYIQYRIKPLSTLSVGQHINTSASIFFDFNAPVATNITDTEVVMINGLTLQNGGSKLSLFPNPTNGIVTVGLQCESDGFVQFRVLNMLGNLIEQTGGFAAKGTFQKQINLSDLPSGIYFVEAQANGRNNMLKLILQ